MGFLIEFVAELLGEIFIITTGAIILWCYYRFKIPFGYFFDSESSKASVTGVFFWISVTVVLGFVYNFK